MSRLNQIHLVANILRYVDEQGLKTLLPRQVNAVITAANLIVEECERPYTPVKPGMTLDEWLKCDDTGLSSLFMAHILYGGPKADYNYPRDADDFGRCHKLVNLCLPMKGGIASLARTGKEWNSLLVDNWPELSELFTSGNHAKLTERIRELTL